MRRGVYVLFCAAVLAAVATYAWRGWYARYITDDFCTAGILRELGFAGAMKFHRDNWSGRFSYFVIKSGLEAIGNHTTRVTPAAMMLLFGSAVAFALRRLVELRSRLLLVAASGCAVYALIDASPSRLNIAPSWFWETGSVTYVLPLLLLTFWLGLLRTTWRLPAVCATGAAVLFVAGGLSETTLATQATVTGLLLLYFAWQRARREAWIAAWGLIATTAALAIVASAAGNIQRGTDQTDPRPLGDTILLTLGYANRFLGWHVFPSGAALLALFAIGSAIGMLCAKQISGRAIGVTVAIATAAYLVSFLPAAWLLRYAIPERTLDVPNFFFAAAVFAAALFAGSRMPPLAIPAVVGLAAIVPLLAVAENVRTMPYARRFAASFDAMDRQLERQKGEDAVVRDGQWAVRPAILGERPGHWVNQCASRYYGLRSLRVEP